MNHFERRDGALFCEGVSLAAIAAAVGTPTYVYSSATLARHFQVFADAFAKERPLIAFAVKANGNIAVLARLAQLGAGADTVSEGEIKRALAARIPAGRIIFSGVGKTGAELGFAAALGLHQINVESVAELDLLANAAAETAGARGGRPQALAIRVNPDVGAGGHDKIMTGGRDSKFGVGAAEALSLYARAAGLSHLAPQGFAVHIGSQIADLDAFRRAFAVLRELTIAARALGHPVNQLDLGGGLGVPYFQESDPPPPAAYAAIVRETLGDLNVRFAFEPGRLIAANAGILLTQVIRLQEREDRRILVLDAGMNDLVRPAMYDAYHELQPVGAPRGALEPFDVVGPICETGDTFARGRFIAPLLPGDLAAFMSAGAYGASMASTYNARALAAEVLVEGARWSVIRARWPIEAQIALESVPDWIFTAS